MSFECLRCNEAWDFEDYVCPCCNKATVDPESKMPLTLKYVFSKTPFEQKETYDVIRISTGKSVFDEPSNYMNREEK